MKAWLQVHHELLTLLLQESLKLYLAPWFSSLEYCEVSWWFWLVERDGQKVRLIHVIVLLLLLFSTLFLIHLLVLPMHAKRFSSKCQWSDCVNRILDLYAQHWSTINCSRWSNSYDFRTAMEIWSTFRNSLLHLAPGIYPCRTISTTQVTGFKQWRVFIIYGSMADILLYYFIPQPPKSSVCICMCACVHMHIYAYICVGKLKLWPAIPWFAPYLWNREFAWFVLWVIWHLVLTSLPYYIHVTYALLHMHAWLQQTT